MPSIKELFEGARARAYAAWAPAPAVEDAPAAAGGAPTRLAFWARVVADALPEEPGSCFVHAVQGTLRGETPGDYPGLQEVAEPTPILVWVGHNAWPRVGDVVLVMPVNTRVKPSHVLIAQPEGLAWANDPGLDGLATIQDNPVRANHLGS